MFIRCKGTAIVRAGLNLSLLVCCAAAQTQKPLTFDPRIPFSTYIREDLFAGFLWGDEDKDERFLRGERNLEILLKERPQDRPGLLAWKGGIAFKRAVDGVKAGRSEVFKREHQQGLDLVAEATRLAPKDAGVAAIIGAGTPCLRIIFLNLTEWKGGVLPTTRIASFGRCRPMSFKSCHRISKASYLPEWLNLRKEQVMRKNRRSL